MYYNTLTCTCTRTHTHTHTRTHTRAHCLVYTLTLDAKVVGVSEVLLGESGPLLGDLAHLLAPVSRQHLIEGGGGIDVKVITCTTLH